MAEKEKAAEAVNAKPESDGPGEDLKDVIVHKLVLKVPKRKDRGYLKRQRTALNFSAKLDAMEINEKVVDEIIEFCLPYVIEPDDRDDAREALEWASEDEIKELLAAISGSEDTASPNRRRPAR
jgi:hypothetical protein